MASREFILAILIGALLAVPYCLYARQWRRPARAYAGGLTVAALIYVGFALASDAGAALPVELGGVLLFALLGLAGTRWSLDWLAAGWLMHIVWDLALHPVDHSGYVPWWYPLLCIGFDLFVAGFILAAGHTARDQTGE